MKTRFYILLTGLLMAACLTSNGQEIVSEFFHTCGWAFSYNDLVTCSDGSVMSGIFCYNPNSFEDVGIHVCKYSPEGQLIDSTTFASAWELYEIPNMPDTFVLPEYYKNSVDSTMNIVTTLIDANLNILSIDTTCVISGIDPQTIEIDAMCISPNGDILVSFWIGETFYLARIGLNGTLLAFHATEGILPYNYSYTQVADSTLHYESFGVFRESPECFYKLGGFIADEDEPWPLFVYLFDSKLRLTDTIVYSNLDGSIYCDYGTREHITPLNGSTSEGSYLLAAILHFPNDNYATSLIKYDADNGPVAYTTMTAPANMVASAPSSTIVTADNKIYHTYLFSPNGSTEIGLARLDENLEIIWNIRLPHVLYGMTYGTTLKVLPNGDIVASIASYRGASSRLYFYIIRDNDLTETTENALDNMNFEFYPSPVKDLLNLRFDDGEEPESVELYNLVGRLVASRGNNIESIDMSAMSSGVYMLCVTMKDGRSYHEKIIKE